MSRSTAKFLTLLSIIVALTCLGISYVHDRAYTAQLLHEKDIVIQQQLKLIEAMQRERQASLAQKDERITAIRRSLSIADEQINDLSRQAGYLRTELTSTQKDLEGAKLLLRKSGPPLTEEALNKQIRFYACINDPRD